MLPQKERIQTDLNGICPYFTMFPLDFPYRILKRFAKDGDGVADPFCGRGTTLFASRLLGLPCFGIDSHPVAVAISEAKLANASPNRIMQTAKHILNDITEASDIPRGNFWDWAFNSEVLRIICRLREGLLNNCDSHSRKALRGIILGALHGPIHKTKKSYFSNQSPRTYAPKPDYAVRFWKSHGLKPPKINVLKIIEERAERYFKIEKSQSNALVRTGDSRDPHTFENLDLTKKVKWVITSPPYYGMTTYMPDQWLRLWFLGGTPKVKYSFDNQIKHLSQEIFIDQLRQVWTNLNVICDENARLIIRFGAINNRKVNPIEIIKESLKSTQWNCITRKAAGSASKGKRQSLHFSSSTAKALEEYDIWASS
jgi:hypothetical protein